MCASVAEFESWLQKWYYSSRKGFSFLPGREYNFCRIADIQFKFIALKERKCMASFKIRRANIF
jgi:hypothetical protein